MASSTPNNSEIDILRAKLSKITDPAQLAKSVNANPQLIFDTISLFLNNHDVLERRNRELEAANQQSRGHGNQDQIHSQTDPTHQVLSRLADLLQPAQQKSILMKDGEAFSGAREDYYPWKESILLKLNTNADHFPSEHSKLAHVYSQMNTASKAHIASWVRNGFLLFESVEQMIALLDTVFGDPNRVRDAVNRLHSNFQRNKSFATWIVEIRKDASIAGYDLDSRSLLDLIFYNMSIELKQALVHERDIDSLKFDQVIARLQDIDNRQRAISRLISNHRNRRQNILQPSFQPSQGPIQAGDLMDLSATSSSKKGPLTKEEKDRHRTLNLCIYCAGSGHFIQNCPVKPNREPTSLRTANISEAEVAEVSGNGEAL